MKVDWNDDLGIIILIDVWESERQGDTDEIGVYVWLGLFNVAYVRFFPCNSHFWMRGSASR